MPEVANTRIIDFERKMPAIDDIISMYDPLESPTRTLVNARKIISSSHSSGQRTIPEEELNPDFKVFYTKNYFSSSNDRNFGLLVLDNRPPQSKGHDPIKRLPFVLVLANTAIEHV